METLGRQSVGTKIFAQSLPKTSRSAEPDTCIAPLRHSLSDALTVQSAIFTIHQQMQLNPGGFGICRESVYRRLIVVCGRMEQINCPGGRVHRTVLKSSNEGGNADACADSDLVWLRILKVKAAIRSFHGDWHANLQTSSHTAGVVT